VVRHRRQTGVGELALREETVAKEIDKVCLTPKCCTEGVSSQFGRHVEKLDVGDGRASVFPYFDGGGSDTFQFNTVYGAKLRADSLDLRECSRNRVFHWNPYGHRCHLGPWQ
jgi:hypothetical protein